MSALCSKCGVVIPTDLVKAGHTHHPTCATSDDQIPLFARAIDPSGMSFLEVDIRNELTEIINWWSRNTPRNKQVAVGPSDLGTPCDRELAYRIAGLGTVQSGDPLPSIVGTATHSWMAEAVTQFERHHGFKRYGVEMKVAPHVVLPGSTDLYRHEQQLVLDWKFPGPDVFREMRKQGFSHRYRVQLNLYGLGHIRAGRPVRNVGIVAMSRSGSLRDMWVKIEPYDEKVAMDALSRMYRLGDFIDKEGILDDPSRWSMIDPTPSRLCGYCRMYRSGGPADGTGCPGK
jgi:hypothetical protein